MGFFSGGSQNGGSESEGNNDDYYAQAKRNRSSSVLIFVLIIAAYLIYTFFFQGSACAGQPTTTGRVKLADGLCSLTQFIYPEGGVSDYSTNTEIQEPMVDFYTSSGVQPVLYDLTGEKEYSQEELQKIADEFYADDMFSKSGINSAYDEGHFLIAFQAYGTDSFKVAYHVGKDAATVMDDDAVETFTRLLTDNFSKKKSPDVFKATFQQANSKIMGRSQANIYLIIIVGVIFVLYFGYNMYKMKKNRGQ